VKSSSYRISLLYKNQTMLSQRDADEDNLKEMLQPPK